MTKLILTDLDRTLLTTDKKIAVAEVKAIANEITLSKDEDGVAVYLEKLLR